MHHEIHFVPGVYRNLLGYYIITIIIQVKDWWNYAIKEKWDFTAQIMNLMGSLLDTFCHKLREIGFSCVRS